MSKQQHAPQQHPLIFTERRLLPRLLDIFLTLIAWAGFGWLIYVGMVKVIISHPDMGPRPVHSTFSTLGLYLVIAVAYGTVLILWAKYNQYRFRTERRSRKPGLEDHAVAESFQISPAVVSELNQARVSVVHHDEQGVITAVDVKNIPLPAHRKA